MGPYNIVLRFGWLMRSVGNILPLSRSRCGTRFLRFSLRDRLRTDYTPFVMWLPVGGHVNELTPIHTASENRRQEIRHSQMWLKPIMLLLMANCMSLHKITSQQQNIGDFRVFVITGLSKVKSCVCKLRCVLYVAFYLASFVISIMHNDHFSMGTRNLDY